MPLETTYILGKYLQFLSTSPFYTSRPLYCEEILLQSIPIIAPNNERDGWEGRVCLLFILWAILTWDVIAHLANSFKASLLSSEKKRKGDMETWFPCFLVNSHIIHLLRKEERTRKEHDSVHYGLGLLRFIDPRKKGIRRGGTLITAISECHPVNTLNSENPLWNFFFLWRG